LSRDKRGSISNATDKSNLQFKRQSNPEQEVSQPPPLSDGTEATSMAELRSVDFDCTVEKCMAEIVILEYEKEKLD
jgi:hypothetical protein